MSTESAIARSISHNEIALVEGIGDIKETLAEVALLAEDSDSARLDNGQYDVWGAMPDGQEFRLRLCLAPFPVGTRVRAGEGEDEDTGRVSQVDGDSRLIAWYSGVTTWTPVETLED